ncbi:MAG: pyridoxal phosphate-dependent aminotransferase, partial [Pseudomonadota bacterium]
QEVATSRARLERIAVENGLTALPSATNFVTMDCGLDGAFARAVLTALLDQGVFVRMPFVAPQDRCIRVGCGRPADMDLVAETLPVALHRARTLETA